MSIKSFNLVYSTHSKDSSNFFNNIKKMNKVVLDFKASDEINNINSDDEKEIGRGNSYAVFPELVKMVENKEPITIDAFRSCLESRGITDNIFQNKILSLVLQSKAGLHFGLGNLLNSLLMENGHEFVMNDDYKLSLKVLDNKHIKIKFTGNWRNTTNTTEAPDLRANVSFDITPDKISIESFHLTQLTTSPESIKAFDFLNANQANLLEKIFIFLKNLFSLNADIEIENVSKDHLSWYPNAKINHPVDAIPNTIADSASPDEQPTDFKETSFQFK